MVLNVVHYCLLKIASKINLSQEFKWDLECLPFSNYPYNFRVGALKCCGTDFIRMFPLPSPPLFHVIWSYYDPWDGLQIVDSHLSLPCRWTVVSTSILAIGTIFRTLQMMKLHQTIITNKCNKHNSLLVIFKCIIHWSPMLMGITDLS